MTRAHTHLQTHVHFKSSIFAKVLYVPCTTHIHACLISLKVELEVIRV